MKRFFFPRSPRRPQRAAFVRLEALEARDVPASFSPQSPMSFGSNLNNNGSVVSGDFNKDGKDDIVLSNYGSSSSDAGDNISILWGNGDSTGTFSNSPLNYDTNASSSDHVSFVAVADVNGDSWQDIVSVQSAVTGAASSFTVFLNTQLNTFQTLPAVATQGNNATWVGVADLNNDSIVDIAITHMGDPVNNNIVGDNIEFYFGVNDGNGKGNGTFTLSQIINPGFEFIPTAGILTDINADGKLDAVVTIPTANTETTIDQQPGKLGLIVNDGFGIFSLGSTYPSSGGPLPISIAAADLNGDGKKDLLVANAGNPDTDNFYADFGKGTTFAWLLADGFGGFSSSGSTATNIRCAFAVVGGDFNNDNKQDAAVVSYGRPLGINGTTIINPINGALVTFHGNGAGAFSLDSVYTDTSEGDQYLAVGQFNAAGGPDIVMVGDHNRVRTHVNINAPNTPPTISDIANQNGSSGATTGPISFTIGDAETVAANLTLSAQSSNTSVMPLANISFGGSGASRTISLTVPPGATGQSLITVTVTDAGGQTAVDTFTLDAGANTPPSISAINDVKVTAGNTVGPISFAVGDNESGAASLVVTAKSNNPALIENADIVLGGTGKTRTVTVTTYAGLSGNTTITVTAKDPGGLTFSEEFIITQSEGASVTSITSTSSNGTYVTGQSVNVSVNFSESVTLSGGNLLIGLDSGGIVSVPPFTGTTASGTYLILGGQTSPDLNVNNLTLSGGGSMVTTVGGSPVSLSLPTSNLANNQNLIVNPPPPTTVSTITVNNGDPQRSRITTMTLNFNNPVNAADFTALGKITLTRTKATSQGTVGTLVQTGATGSFGRINVSPSTGTVTQLTLTFDNGNGANTTAGVENTSLSDGRWQLAIPHLSYTSTANDTNLRRLFGDMDNNGTVDATDFGALNATNLAVDFDNNSTVDSIDTAQFGNRFGLTL